MNKPLTIDCAFHVGHETKRRKQLLVGDAPALPPPGRVPRVAKLLALAHRFERLLHDGVVRDYAELGQLGHVTRARVSQIMALLFLAPDLQEEILFLAPTVQGRDRVQMRHSTYTTEYDASRSLSADLSLVIGIVHPGKGNEGELVDGSHRIASMILNNVEYVEGYLGYY